MQKKNTIFFIAGIVFAAGIVGMMSVRAGNNAVDCSLDFYTAIDIYPVDETMMSAGYEKVTENNWHCVLNNLDVYVTYDYENRICCKNNYYFRLEDLYIKDEKTYLSKNMLEEILTSEISRENNKIVVTEKDYSDFDWTSSPVITPESAIYIQSFGLTPRLGFPFQSAQGLAECSFAAQTNNMLPWTP